MHSARPRVCRTYPLGTGPDDNCDEFLHFIVSKKAHHFVGQAHRVGDWFNENINAEDQEFLKADIRFAGEFARIFQKMKKTDALEKHIQFPMLLYKYFEFDTSEPFMPQYMRNMALLKSELEKLATL